MHPGRSFKTFFNSLFITPPTLPTPKLPDANSHVFSRPSFASRVSLREHEVLFASLKRTKKDYFRGKFYGFIFKVIYELIILIKEIKI